MLKSSPQKSPIFAVSLQEKSYNNLCALKRKHRRIHRAGKSDTELAATLSATTDWDDTDHADLSQIDYQKYKPYRSPKVQKTIEKWL